MNICLSIRTSGFNAFGQQLSFSGFIVSCTDVPGHCNRHVLRGMAKGGVQCSAPRMASYPTLGGRTRFDIRGIGNPEVFATSGLPVFMRSRHAAPFRQP